MTDSMLHDESVARHTVAAVAEAIESPTAPTTLRIIALEGNVPISGAVARLDGTARSHGDRRSGSDGRIEFSDGIPDRGSVTVSAAGYFTERAQLGELVRTADASGSCFVALRSAADLEVRVLDQDGAPIQGAFVTVYPYDSQTGGRRPWNGWWPSFRKPGWYVTPFSTPQEQRAGTDAQGEVTLLQLPREMDLLVTASGPITRTTGVIAIDKDADRAEIELRGTTGATIVGQFRYEDGLPAEGMSVSFHVAENLIESKKAKTEQDGSLRLVGMQEGPTSGQVESVGTSLNVVDVVAPRTDLGIITIPRQAEISGIIELEEECSRAGTNTLAIDVLKDGQRVAELRPRQIKPGTLEFWGRVPAGRLNFRAASQSIYLDSVEATVPSAAPVVLSVAKRSAILELQAPGLPADVVVDALFVPLDGRGRRVPRRGVIAASTVRGQTVTIERTGDSLFLGCLPPGVWDVEIDAGENGGAVLPGLELKAGTREDRTVRMGWSTIQCTVRDRAGNWLESIEVGLIRGRDGPPDVRTDETGTALFTRVLPGRVSVFPATTGPHGSLVQNVVAEPGGVHQVEFVLDRPTSLRGVITRSGEPEQGASIEAWARFQHSSLGKWRKIAVQSDATGAFSIADVIPGEYELVARSNPERAPALSNHYVVDVRPGDPTELELDLLTDDGTAILVVDELGAPLKGLRHGYAIARRGMSSLELDPNSPGRLLGAPNQGPWLLELSTESYLGAASPMGDGEGSLVVLVPESAPAGELGRLARTGQASLRVESAEDAGVAHVREVRVAALPGAEGLLSTFDPIKLQFRRADGALLVDRLPDGITVRLVGVGRHGEWPLESLVTVEGDTTVKWPVTDG